MARLTIMRGVSGSGKSTRARVIAVMTNAQIVSRDDLRKYFYGSDGADYYAVEKGVLSERENRVSIAEKALIESFLKAGIDVISDNTNIEWKYVKNLAKLGYRYGAEVVIDVLDIDLKTAFVRNAKRAEFGGRMVAHEIIRKQHERFQGTKNNVLDPSPEFVPYSGTPGEPKAFLVDIDGTLAHMNGKRNPFDWKNVGLDDVDETVAEIVRMLMWYPEPYNIIVMSGRDSVCRKETEQWLFDNDIPYDHLFMRPQGDMRPDNLIKLELFNEHIRDNFDVKFVIDDREQVVRMWKMLGLKVLNVAGLDDGSF